jgi:hypothetical protein
MSDCNNYNPDDMSAKPSIVKALIGAKSLLSMIKKDEEHPHFKSHYATLDTLLEMIAEPLSKHGLLLTQPIFVLGDKSALRTVLSLADSTEVMMSEMILPNICDPLKIGSVFNHYRCYAICSLLGITTQEDDVPTTPEPVYGIDAQTLLENEERKAKLVNALRIRIGATGDDVLTMCHLLFKHRNIRILNELDIERLCTRLTQSKELGLLKSSTR